MSIPLYRISQISSVWNALASDNRKYITRIYKERFFIMNWIKKQRKHLRLWVQVLFTALTNGYVIGFTEGKIYRGTSKKLCVPGLNCYSCPGAVGSCPIGSLQALCHWIFNDLRLSHGTFCLRLALPFWPCAGSAA